MQEPEEFADCARRLKALADPERLRIVDSLFCGAKSVSDLAAALGAEIVNVSHHLGVLKAAGIVQVERQGRFMIYSLVPGVGMSSADNCCRIDFGCCALEMAPDDREKPKQKSEG